MHLLEINVEDGQGKIPVVVGDYIQVERLQSFLKAAKDAFAKIDQLDDGRKVEPHRSGGGHWVGGPRS